MFFSYKCVVCGMTEEEHRIKYNEALHVDHVIPISNGGKLVPGNVVLLCKHCNQSKGNKKLPDLSWNVSGSIVRAAINFDLHIRSIYGKEYLDKFILVRDL